MQNLMLEKLLNYPIIAAVKNEEGLTKALDSPCQVVFVLFGDLCTIAEIVQRIKAVGKLAIVHIDLIDGLANREVSIHFLKGHTQADGIISTKATLIRCANTLGLITVARYFLLDSLSLQNAEKHTSATHADFNEVLPGVMPKIIRRYIAKTSVPVIAGGMILDKEDVVSALSAGATAVSTSQESLWEEE